MKKILKKYTLLIILNIFLCLILTSCNNQKTYLKVLTTYGGYGIAGQPLENGSFEKILKIKEGDKFFELENGKWNNKNTNVNFDNKILEIKEINENEITFITINNEEITLKFNESYEIPSLYTICDGINYTYTISFNQN